MADTLSIETTKKPHFLNKEEQLCFNILNHAVDNNMYILPKIRIADIFEQETEKKESAFWVQFYLVSDKHLDFLICSKDDFAPLLALRIRGESHHEAIDANQEAFIQAVFAHSHIPILDVSLTELGEYKENFSEYAFHGRIREALGLE